MKILTRIWKKRLNEAGIPVLHIIDETMENYVPAWGTQKTPQTVQFLRGTRESYGAVSFRIE
jgi:hypothetical protein